MNNVPLNKITYILGAGASALALPTVKPTATNPGFTAALRELSSKLSTDSTINASYNAFRDEFCTNLNWLADEGDRHSTVDSFAQFCYKKRDEKSFNKIRVTLELFFVIKQFIENLIDNRYLPFVTKCLDDRGIFCNNIKIINWNYDFQLQIAAETHSQEEFVAYAHYSSHKPPLIKYFPALGREHYGANNTPSLIHLNGIAGFYEQRESGFTLSYFFNGNLRDINHLFEKILHSNDTKAGSLTFAFEYDGSYGEKRTNLLKEMIAETDYLVIIGYSFPIDNIETDKLIFDALLSGGLKGIYYQDPFNTGEFLRDLFDIPSNIFIKPEPGVDSLLIPRESRLPKKPAIVI